MAEIDSQIKQMEKDDIIEPSFSPWNAPLLLVKKKLDASQIPKFRIVVDFRALNKVTINEYHPLPNITEILDQLGQCNLFSIIDLASGFYQIKLDEKSKELTAFSTNQGHWHFKKMAMGLKTSPCSFQRLMNNVMAGIVGIKCLVYLDDIIIYGKGLLDHNEKIRNVFERLRNHNLKIQPTKCEFLKQQCMYLGHIISENGIQSDPEKIKSVLKFPIPASVKEIKSFLGLSGYYRKFIKSYSLISKPMTNLLRKDVTFNWDTSCQEAFDKLKNILCSEPILQYPDFTKPFIVTTDASGKALGAILSQGEVSQDLPIAYASRTLSKCEKEYDYEIKYKPGVLNSNVDALSRMYTIHEIKEESYPAFLNKFETQLITNKCVKEVNGSLIESPEEYHIVSEIEKHYNFMSGVNYEIKQKFGNGQKLAPSKEIGEDHSNMFCAPDGAGSNKPYRISRLTQENGMYFGNQGPLRLTNSDWKLLIYVKLDNFNQLTKDTMDFYKRTLIICNDLTIAYEGMFKTTCDNFKLTSNSLEREVSRKRFYMLQSIDETDTVTREKRGLVNSNPNQIKHKKPQYKNDADFSLFIKMVVTLSFVPIEDLDAAIQQLGDDLPECLQPLFDWFEDNYVGRTNRNGRDRRTALFSPHIWNLHLRVLNSQDRTNNHAEAANRRLNVEMGVQHPSLWSFINCLRKVQAGRDVFYNQLEAGKNPPKKLKKFIDADKCILRLVESYETRTKISFLRGIAQNISLHLYKILIIF
ncbi:hypothetical protein QTP88_020767 [Uroleucon formosanum]